MCVGVLRHAHVEINDPYSYTEVNAYAKHESVPGGLAVQRRNHSV